MIKLRDYQLKAIDDLTQAGVEGKRRLLLVAPTGSGKTLISSKIIQNATANGYSVLFLAHRRELIFQCAEKLRLYGLSPGLILAQEPQEPGKKLQVASIQSYLVKVLRRKKMDKPLADLVVFDECFPGWVKVGSKPIREIRVGDFVPSYFNGRVLYGRVTKKFIRKPESLVTVKTSCGEITCTSNHPLLTDEGWKPASKCGKNMILSTIYELPYMQKQSGKSSEAQAYVLEKNRENVLLKEMFSGIRFKDIFVNYGEDKSDLCLGAHEDKQPDEETGCKKQGEHYLKGNWLEAKSSRRKWEAYTPAATAVGFEAGMGIGVRGFDREGKQEEGIPDELQDRYSTKRLKDRDRSGRLRPWSIKDKRTGSKKGEFFNWARVEDIEVHEPGSDGKYGGLCPEGLVYNLEVEPSHTYIANGFVVHNCHHLLSAKTWLRILAEYPEAIVLGMTATPINRRGAGMGHCFDAMVKCPSISQLTKEGYLVPARYFAPSIPDLQGVKIQAGDYNEKQLEDRMDKPVLIGEVCENWSRICPDRRTIVFASGVKHSIHLAEQFRKIGIKAEHVDGMTEKEERDLIIGRFRSGDTQVLVNCQVLCLDSKTEILTENGWKGIGRITKEDMIANWGNGIVTFERPIDIIVRKRLPNERMVILETPRRSIRVTETHRMLWRYAGWGWKKSAAADLVGKKIEIPVSGTINNPKKYSIPQEEFSQSKIRRLIACNSYNYRKRGMPAGKARTKATFEVRSRYELKRKNPEELSVDECRLLGYWLGDGTKTNLKNGGIEYKLCQGLHCENIVRWVDDLLAKLGICNIKRINNNCASWSLSRGTGFGEQKRAGVFHIEPYLDKSIPNFFFGLSNKQTCALLDGLWLSDGNHGDGRGYGRPKKSPGVKISENIERPRSFCIYGANERMLSRIQALACVNGFLATLKKSENGLGHILYSLSLRQDEERHSCTKYKFQFEDGWKEENVWCVSVSKKNIITRRSGSVTVMGNTEGFDCPEASALVFARPTKSLLLYLQVAGRVLRSAPNKKDCIAEGQLVLTERGLVPIEKINSNDRLWDGRNWICHRGIVYKGEREVITYAGLTATPEHEVRTRMGWKTFRECSEKRIPLAQTGIGGKEIWEGENYIADSEMDWGKLAQEKNVRSGSMRNMLKAVLDFLDELKTWENWRLPTLWTTKTISNMVLVASCSSQTKVRKQKIPFLESLWGAWDKIQFFFSDRRLPLDHGSFGYSSGIADRQDRQRWGLRARQSQMVYSGTKSFAYKQTNQSNSRKMESAISQTKRKVWDILDAGPRHCFTVSGILVHNCIIIDHSGVVYEHGPVDQDFDWKLDYEKGTIGEQNFKRKKEREKRQITCKNCKLVYEGRLRCPECGWKPDVKGKPVETYEAYLQELDVLENPPVDKRSWWNGLRGYAVSKGWKQGWAYYKYKEKFGVGPSNLWRKDQPIEPSLEVKSWIQHLNIKWAKRKEKERQAQAPARSMPKKVVSHGYERIDKLAGDAYVREVEDSA